MEERIGHHEHPPESSAPTGVDPVCGMALESVSPRPTATVEWVGHGGPGIGSEGMAGARLEFRSTDPSQLDALREHVRWHQQRMHSGECWMLERQPTDTPRGKQE